MITAATIAFRAGRWPIQTSALIAATVFAAYVFAVELNPSVLPGSLTRSFYVESASKWTPIVPTVVPPNTPRFVGFPVVFPSAIGRDEESKAQLAAVRDHVASVSGTSELFHESSKTPRSAETGRNSAAAEIGASYAKSVLPESKLSSALEELKTFEVNGQQWELQSSSPSFLTYMQFYYSKILDLLGKASYFDIGSISAGWLGMYYTFFNSFLQLRALGSRTFSFLSAVMSSGLAFLCAYAVTVTIGISVPKLALVQGLPFFVLVVGFNNKVRIAREALSNPKQSSAAEAVKNSVADQFGSIARESLLEATVMVLAGVSTSIPALFEFSVLSVSVLSFDLAFLITFYVALVSSKVAMVQVDRNDAVRRTLQEDGVSCDVASAYADEVSHSSSHARAARYTHFKWLGGSVRLSLVFGFFAVNWVNIVHFPISFSMHLSDLAGLQVNEFAQRSPVPSVFTVIPASRFAPSSRSGIWSNQAWGVIKAAPATSFVALIVSLICNGYLAGIIMRQSNTPLSVTPGAVTPSAVSPIKKETAIPPKVDTSVSAISPSSTSPTAAKSTSPTSGKTIGAGEKLSARQHRPSLGRIGGASPRKPSEKIGSTGRTPSGGSATAAGTAAAPRSRDSSSSESLSELVRISSNNRSPEECEQMLKEGKAPLLTNEQLIALVVSGKSPLYALEKQLKDTTRAVVVRRAAVSRTSTTHTLETSELPYKDYNYDRVLGACCENVIGVMPSPLGVAGPVIIDGEEFYLPMATTEGVSVASTMRGCKASNAGGGVVTEISADGMTRGPCVTFNRASRAAACKIYLDSEAGRKTMERAFNSTSRFARLDSLKTSQAGPFSYIRFRAQTGDAMGMNMISKGTERALQVLAEECGFDDMTIVSVSGNYCTDKKAAAINWIDGRGKSVVAEGIVPGEIVRTVSKTGVDESVESNMAKNLVGSSMAGALGGFNAHAANLVAASFLATGQDPAQVVEGSNCMTLMSNVDGDSQISVTMPCLEVGTIGGGTILEPQAAMLNMLGVRGPNMTNPGDNARKLARIVATAVSAGEVSSNAALAAGHLVQSHMAHNRAKPAK